MSVVLGGMRLPMVPAQARQPTESSSRYPLWRISGRAMALMATLPARESPTTAPKAVQAHTLPVASPPRQCPIQLRAARYRS